MCNCTYYPKWCINPGKPWHFCYDSLTVLCGACTSVQAWDFLLSLIALSISSVLTFEPSLPPPSHDGRRPLLGPLLWPGPHGVGEAQGPGMKGKKINSNFDTFFKIFLTWRMGRSGSRWAPPAEARPRRWGGCRWSGTGKVWICKRCATLTFPNNFFWPFLLR